MDSISMARSKKDRPGVIAPPPLIYAAGLAAGLLSQKAFPLQIPSNAVTAVLGLCLIGMGILLAVAGFRAMSRVGTHIDPFKPTTALATDGPFRFTRNPLYLSLTLLYGGVALLVNVPWAILFLPIVLLIMRQGVIGREERYLEQKFGEDYLRYKRSVRRWF
jgi:protein-S-isoprenylcysteine O-methyltransferase Ste14